MVEITSHDASAFKAWQPQQFREVLETLRLANARVSAGTMTAAKYEELEQALGIHWNADGLLASPALAPHFRPIEVATYDWMHNTFQEGVFTVETQAFLGAAGIQRARVEQMLADDAWRFPGSAEVKARQLHRIFDDRRVSAECHCAELLGVYGLLRHFIETEVEDVPALQAHRRSFLAICKVLDLLLKAKHGFADARSAASALRAATCEHLRLHKAAYGEALVRPKHHWMLDVPEQLARDGLVLDAFVVERTHLKVKAVAEHVRNTRSFEASVLASLSTACWNKAAALIGTGCLLGNVAPLPGCPGAVVADRMDVLGCEMVLGDVVLLGDSVGAISGCVRCDGELFAFVRRLRIVGRLSAHSVRCDPTAGLDAWPADGLRLALAWRRLDDSSVLVVRE
jgi:hypothetical protein